VKCLQWLCVICVQLSDSEQAVDERRDPFVAQLYKFMDDRGTPINRAPTFASSDLDLFHLFRLVASMGGYNRVSLLFIVDFSHNTYKPGNFSKNIM